MFVATPSADPFPPEDCGVLLVSALDAARRQALLLVLDAHNMQELARCYVPQPLLVPLSFHGEFFR